MLSNLKRALMGLVVIGAVVLPANAYAACTLPNSITNGQTTDASQVMGNFNAVTTCMTANGTVAGGTAGQVGYYNSSGNQISGESLSSLLDSSIGSTQGSILYRGASGWQALAPGTVHEVLSTNGPGNDPAWVPGGAGSGGKYQAFPNGGSGWSDSAAAMLNVIYVYNTITVTDLASLFSPVSGGTYVMGIAGWDAANNKITSTPAYTTSQTVTTGGSGIPVFFSFSTPDIVTPGAYAVMLIRTDGTPTTSLSLYYGGGPFWAPQLSMAGTGTVFHLASQAPTTSDVWSSDGSGIWDFALMYTY
jgi:hypothetical protein